MKRAHAALEKAQERVKRAETQYWYTRKVIEEVRARPPYLGD